MRAGPDAERDLERRVDRAGRIDGAHLRLIDKHVKRLFRLVARRLGGRKRERVRSAGKRDRLADAARSLDKTDLKSLWSRPVPLRINAAVARDAGEDRAAAVSEGPGLVPSRRRKLSAGEETAGDLRHVSRLLEARVDDRTQCGIAERVGKRSADFGNLGGV